MALKIRKFNSCHLIGADFIGACGVDKKIADQLPRYVENSRKSVVEHRSRWNQE